MSCSLGKDWYRCKIIVKHTRTLFSNAEGRCLPNHQPPYLQCTMFHTIFSVNVIKYFALVASKICFLALLLPCVSTLHKHTLHSFAFFTPLHNFRFFRTSTLAETVDWSWVFELQHKLLNWMHLTRDDAKTPFKTGAPPGAHSPIRRGTFKVSKRR